MSATTLETWVADGVLLNTHAKNISTFGGRSGLPAIRGENKAIPLRGGRAWTPKLFDQRELNLAMWVQGVDDDGNIPSGHTARAEFNVHLRELKKLFGKRNALIQMVRQVDMPGGLLQLTGAMECVDTMEPTFLGVSSVGTFTVKLIMPDPYWYGVQATATLTSSGLTLVHPGDTNAERMVIQLNGPLTNPMITNTALGISLRYSGTIAGGSSVTINTSTFTAVETGNINRVGKLSNIGSYWWMNFQPGNNPLTLTNWQGGALGAGNAGISYYPPYL